MSAERAERDDSEKDTDDELRRRVAALAALRWADVDYDVRNVGEWGALSGVHTVGVGETAEMDCRVESDSASMEFEEGRLTDTKAYLSFDEDGVTVSLEGHGDREAFVAAGALLTPAQCRELAAMLAQAAEEQERWSEASDQ